MPKGCVQINQTTLDEFWSPRKADLSSPHPEHNLCHAWKILGEESSVSDLFSPKHLKNQRRCEHKGKGEAISFFFFFEAISFLYRLIPYISCQSEQKWFLSVYLL